ncbi:hypothetical protein [Spirillospora sp. NPDC047279]|uniref:hypothetical protein n=1 Tax=Spirillospora sp. NPDC047279 TaxID=3155478 RepID=UPI0033FD930D
MASLDRPREADTDQHVNPRQDAVETLARLLRGQDYTAIVHNGFLVASAGLNVRPVRVWCQPRRSDGNRLWFHWTGATPICEADKPYEALTAIKGHLEATP